MNSHFRALKAEHTAGNISKPDFISQAHHQFHSILFDLAAELGNTDIASIEIVADKVYMVSKTDQIRLAVDSLDQRTAPIEILNFDAYEPELSTLIRNLAPHISTMLDIGANIGWYSLLVSKTNPAALIHAFEPIPFTFERLKLNVELNNSSNIYMHNYGLSSSSGTFPFYFYPQGGVNASLHNLANRIDVQVVNCTLNALSDVEADLHVNNSIDFIKCDVEGNELFVVQGGLATIEKYKPIILLELLRKWSARFNYHPNDVLTLLHKIGYLTYICSSSGSLVPFGLITDATIETNFVFVHPKSRLREWITFE